MPRPRTFPELLLATALVVAASAGCDRRVEPYDPDEKVEAPDLSRIFPPGAERAARKEGAPGAPPAPAAAPAEPIRGTVRLAPGLEGRLPGSGVLFIVARGPQAGPPLAVKRVPEPRFPLDFELGPDDRMLQGIPFRGPIRLSARVDADRNARTRNPGDLQGELAEPVEPGARGVTIVIDEIL